MHFRCSSCCCAVCGEFSARLGSSNPISGHHHPAHSNGTTHRNADAGGNDRVATQAHERAHHAAHQELRKSHDGGPRAGAFPHHTIAERGGVTQDETEAACHNEQQRQHQPFRLRHKQ